MSTQSAPNTPNSQYTRTRASTHASKKTSFTKRLLVFFIVVALMLTFLTIKAAFRADGSAEVLARVTEVWYGGLTVIVGLYIWKSKNENRYKYGQMWINAIADKYGIENAARFFETTVKGD